MRKHPSLLILVLVVIVQSDIAASEDKAALPADSYRQLRRAAAEAMQKQDMRGYRDAVRKLHAMFPNNSRFLRNAALAEAQMNNASGALEFLRDYGRMGMILDMQNPSFSPLRDIAQQLPEFKVNASPVKHGEKIFAVPNKDLLVEDISYDPTTKRFILSSAHERKIVSCDESPHCEDIVNSSPDLPLGSVLAIRVDAKRNVLWATSAGMSAAANFQQSEDGSSSLLKFDLNSHRLIKRYEPADGKKHAMGDMVVASNGDVYVSDGLSGDLFCVSREKDVLESLAPQGWFFSPQTPALSADEQLLYVPDYAEGIAIIRLADRHFDWLRSTVAAALEGIDGLYLQGDHLIAIQNGTLPERIVRFHLQTPLQIDGFEVLEANWDGLGDPTHGVLVGNDFYFIINSGWNYLDDKGSFTPRAPAEIMKLH